MRLVVTGGGTGGHVYPALEIAREATERGAEVHYFGSFRGQEGEASHKAGLAFSGFHVFPFHSLGSPRGWLSLLAAFRASRGAKKKLVAYGADVVFSTGGYSAAPVVLAARSLGIPFVIHEANSVPGKSNKLFMSRARSFTCAFRCTAQLYPSAIRTGQPIRKELRRAATERKPGLPLVLVAGGSQGSAFLNEVGPSAARLVKSSTQWLHSTGPAHIETVRKRELPPEYRAEPFLDGGAMATALAAASLALSRSGGTLAEYALFRLPSVLIPLPTSADDHQVHNAMEFAEMGVSTVLLQDQASPRAVAEAIDAWLGDSLKRQRAETGLADWDVPDATSRITELVLKT